MITHYVGDLQPAFQDVLRYLDGTPVDLHDPNVDHVTLTIRRSNGTVKLQTTIQVVPTNDPEYEQGLVRYLWHAEDVDTAEDMTFWTQIHYADSSTLTQPPDTIRFLAVGTGPSARCGQWISGDDVALAECAPASSDPGVFDAAAEMASSLLYAWSGARYAGLCTRTIRPSPARCTHWVGMLWPWIPPGWGWRTPAGYGGAWGCADSKQLDLYGHVRRVVRITVNGDVLDPSAYRVDAARWLIRIDGHAWPGCQDLSRPVTEAGTFAVTYEWGIDPPLLGVQAAIALACELSRAMLPGEECEIPASVSQLSRQGTTWQLARGAERTLLPQARGIDLVDAFLRSLPMRGKRPPIVVNPQALQHRRTD